MNGKVDALDKADMFALGIVMFELAATSSFDLPREGQVYQDLRRGNPPMLPTRTATFRKIVKALLAENPADRPSAERALKMLSKAAAGGKGTQDTASPAPVGTAEPMQS
jgi:serine/threonine protein kinase